MPLQVPWIMRQRNCLGLSQDGCTTNATCQRLSDEPLLYRFQEMKLWCRPRQAVVVDKDLFIIRPKHPPIARRRRLASVLVHSLLLNTHTDSIGAWSTMDYSTVLVDRFLTFAEVVVQGKDILFAVPLDSSSLSSCWKARLCFIQPPEKGID